MVTYNLKNNKTKKANRLSKNGKNKNISRKTMKNKKNKHNRKNKHNKNNKHNKDGKAYHTFTKKQLINKYKYNRTKKLVGGIYKTISKIKTNFDLKRIGMKSKKIFSFHRKEAKNFMNCKSIRDELKKFLNIKDSDIIKSSSSITPKTTKLFISDILTNIYLKFSNINIVGDSCIQKMINETKINEKFKNNKKITAKLKIIGFTKTTVGSSRDLLKRLKHLKLNYIKERFNEFLIALNISNTNSNLYHSQVTVVGGNDISLPNYSNSDNQSNQDAIRFKNSIKLQRQNENEQKTIYQYDDLTNNLLFKGIILKNKNTYFDESTEHNIKILDFKEIYNIKNTIEDFNTHYQYLKNKRNTIEELLIELFSYYSIFRVLDNDKTMGKIRINCGSKQDLKIKKNKKKGETGKIKT